MRRHSLLFWNRLTTSLHGGLAVAFLLLFSQISSAANPSCTMPAGSAATVSTGDMTHLDVDVDLDLDVNVNKATQVKVPTLAAANATMDHQHHSMMSQHIASNPSDTVDDGKHSKHKNDNTCSQGCDCSLSCAGAIALQPASLRIPADAIISLIERKERPHRLSGFSPRPFRPPTLS